MTPKITLCKRYYDNRQPEFEFTYFFWYEDLTYGDCEFSIKQLFNKDEKEDRLHALQQYILAGEGEIICLDVASSVEELKYKNPQWIL